VSARRVRIFAVRAWAIWLMVAVPVALRAALPVGSEFAINSYTSSNQKASSVGLDADGDFVVVWQSYTQDGSQYGIFGQRFTSAGVASGVEFQVSTYTSNQQMGPRVGVEDDGDFTVVWASAQDGSGYGIFARRFASSGAPLGPELQVNTYTSNGQSGPGLAMEHDGDFVVAWASFGEDGSSYGVFARRFASNGNPTTGAFQVNTYSVDNQRGPSVAVEGDGDFVVVWQSNAQDGDGSGVFGRRFASSGSAIGGELQIHTYTTSHQTGPTVAMLAGGAFVVAWNGNFPGGSLLEIRGRRFDSSGAAIGGEFQVNTVTGGTQNYARLASDDDGALVVVWEFLGVKARSFGASGPVSPEFQVDGPTGGGYALALDLNAGGDFVVTWSRYGADGGQSGVLGRRNTVLSPLLDVDLSSDIGPLTDGLLVLRHGFGFTGATLVTGAVSPNCLRCESAAIAAFIDANLSAFDVDGDGAPEPLTDAILIVRYLFGFRGTTLVTGAVDAVNCTRCDAAAIEPYIAGQLLVP
jgi:hypothetical protein